ncbi:hypothetical protein D3C77_231560 [compost metagenome]
MPSHERIKARFQPVDIKLLPNRQQRLLKVNRGIRIGQCMKEHAFLHWRKRIYVLDLSIIHIYPLLSNYRFIFCFNSPAIRSSWSIDTDLYVKSSGVSVVVCCEQQWSTTCFSDCVYICANRSIAEGSNLSAS